MTNCYVCNLVPFLQIPEDTMSKNLVTVCQACYQRHSLEGPIMANASKIEQLETIENIMKHISRLQTDISTTMNDLISESLCERLNTVLELLYKLESEVE